MARTNGEGRLKKHSCCLTCSIVCLILLIVFVVALYVGGTFMFKTYVCPHIGGLSLNFGSVTITEVACALILGIITNIVLKGKEKNNKE